MVLKFKHLYQTGFLILAFFCFTSGAWAANIKGVVKDKNTGETLVGANIFFLGTTTGTSTDINGAFLLENIKPGNYDLAVSFISYKMHIIKGVNVKKDTDIELNVDLEAESTQLQSVTVSARKATNTDISIISSIKSSGLVINGITAQQISRSQDSDASQVVRRMPGVTLIDDRFIMIRGLSERYNYTMLNQMTAPGMETDVRSFSFDILPSNLIEQILIFKSPSADLPSDFGGGIVKIITKGVPDKNYFSVSYSSGFRSGTTFEDYSNSKISGLELLGFNSGKNDLDEKFPADLRQVGDMERLEHARGLKNNWLAQSSKALPDQSLSATAAYVFDLGNLKIGNTTALLYNNSYKIQNVLRQEFNAYDFELEKSSVIYDFTDNQNKQNIRSGIMHDWVFEIGKHSRIEFKNLFNQLASKEYVYRTGNHYDFGYYADNHSFQDIYRGIYTGQLSGEHKYREGLSVLDWAGGFSYSYRDEPDYRRYRSDRDTITNQLTLYIPAGAAAAYFLGRYYSGMNEDNTMASVNYTHKINPSERFINVSSIKAGFFAENKNRAFVSRNIGYIRSSILSFDQGLTSVSIDSLFQSQNINGTSGISIDEQSNPSDSYTASVFNAGSYVMGTVQIGKNLSIGAGLRFEFNRQGLNSFTLTNDPVNINNPELFILPSANLTYKINAKQQLRLGYGKTYNRPEFREIAPFGFYDFNYNRVVKGNPELNTCFIQNMDLRWELYPSISEMITAGVFYKYFNSPIESIPIEGGGSGGIKTVSFANADAATSVGLETEIRKSIFGNVLNPLSNNISVILNASLIRSRVDLGNAMSGSKYSERPMMGQSDYSINAGIVYEHLKYDLTLSVLYNKIGARVVLTGTNDLPETYELSGGLLDFSLTKRFKNNIEVKAGMTNLLNTDNILIQDANLDGNFNKLKDQIIESYSSGIKCSIGISYKL